jgi:colanic acid/amylovoran biosynthesis glycosyltransferase
MRMRIGRLSYNPRMEGLPTVVLLTGSYPYEVMGEDTFVGPELPHLVREFARVIVVPAARGGKRADLPEGAEVDESLAASLAARRGPLNTLRDALACPPVAEEVGARFGALWSLAALRRLVAFGSTATRTARWYEQFAKERHLDPRSTILYTYWLGALSAGLVLSRRGEPSLLVVSRGHRVDVHEEDQSPPYLPCRRWLMGLLDRVFLVSEAGRLSLAARHPAVVDRLAVSRLGSPDPGFLAWPSADCRLRVVSCSAFLPVKRVDVLARGLGLAAGRRPDRIIEWQHFGEGPLRLHVEALLTKSSPRTLLWDFRGHVSNAQVFERYRSQPTDAFLNASRDEGIPVSIMEAQSCGIPVMAPAVGGVPEAVSPENGFLLPAPATADAVADVVCSVLETPDLLRPRRDRSRSSWETRFCAGHNLAAFARELSSLRRARCGETS